jgi:hypothetical protein
MSHRRFEEFFPDWIAVPPSVAPTSQCLRESARANEPVVEEQLLVETRASDLLPDDERSSWVFMFATTTLFAIRRSTQELLDRLLGSALTGWLMSFGYCTYRDHDNRLRCLTHLVRKAHGPAERPDRQAREFVNAFRRCLDTVMDAVYAALEGSPPVPLRDQHAQPLNALFVQCLRRAEAKQENPRSVARELLNPSDTFWVALDHPELPPTNSDAGRARRHRMIARRIRYGTQNPWVACAFTLLASVIEAGRQRVHSPWFYLAQAIPRRRGGNPADVFPVAVA